MREETSGTLFHINLAASQHSLSQVIEHILPCVWQDKIASATATAPAESDGVQIGVKASPTPSAYSSLHGIPVVRVAKKVHHVPFSSRHHHDQRRNTLLDYQAVGDELLGSACHIPRSRLAIPVVATSGICAPRLAESKQPGSRALKLRGTSC